MHFLPLSLSPFDRYCFTNKSNPRSDGEKLTIGFLLSYEVWGRTGGGRIGEKQKGGGDNQNLLDVSKCPCRHNYSQSTINTSWPCGPLIFLNSSLLKLMPHSTSFNAHSNTVFINIIPFPSFSPQYHGEWYFPQL